MKARYPKQPAMVTIIEFNERYGTGYQARMVMDGILSSVLDSEPFSLEDALAGTVNAIETLNRETGYNYKPWEVISIAQDAIERNGDEKQLRELTGEGGTTTVINSNIIQ